MEGKACILCTNVSKSESFHEDDGDDEALAAMLKACMSDLCPRSLAGDDVDDGGLLFVAFVLVVFVAGVFVLTLGGAAS